MPKRRRSKGFTIAEILIAIMVISIAILGTIAAIAFGLRASGQGADNTVAIQINRKVMENMLQAVIDPDPSITTFFATRGNPANDVRGNAAWHPIYIQPKSPAWFSLDDYGFRPINYNSADCLRFQRDTDRLQLNVFSTPAVTDDNNPVANDALSSTRYFFQVTVTTRWQAQSRWKWVETKAFSRSGLPK